MLEFIELRFRNFLSFGQVEQVVKLNDKSYQLITGINKDKDADDEGNKNGLGKSSIFNALHYSLFGEAIGNKIKLPNLINNINKKEMETSITFKKDDVLYRIERGRKPNYLRFYKNDNELISDESQGDSRNTQNDINKVLGMSSDLFTQTILLSCQVPIFLEQSTANQKVILEQILGVDVITNKINKLKEVIKETKNELNNEDFRVKTLKTQQETLKNVSLQHYNDSITNKERWDKEHSEAIIKLNSDIDGLKNINFDKEIESINNYNNYSLRLKEYQTYITNKEQLTTQIINSNSNIEKYKKELELIKAEDIDDLLKSFDENEKTLKLEQEYKIKDAEHKALMIKANSLKSSIANNERKIDDYNKEMDSIKANICPTCGQPINENDVKELKETLTQKINIIVDENKKFQEDMDKLLNEYNSFVEQTFTYLPTGKYKYISEVLSLKNRISLLEQYISNELSAITDNYGKIQSLEKFDEPEKVEMNSSYKTIEAVLKDKTSLEVLEKRLVTMVDEKNPFEEQVIKYKNEYDSITTDVDDSKLIELSETQQHNETLLKLLNNPSSFIRKAILEQSLEILNEKIGYYLDKLGSMHRVIFNNDMDIEITQNGLEFGYVSSGEMGRISLALTFAFRDVWENLNNCKVNLLMIDEVIDRNGLDINGVSMLINCIRSMIEKNIFVVSHNEMITNQSSNILRIVKENSFSSIE